MSKLPSGSGVSSSLSSSQLQDSAHFRHGQCLYGSRRVLWGLGKGFELVDGVQGRSHGNVGDPLQNHFDDDGNLVLLSQLAGIGEALLDVFGILDTNRLAAQTLGHSHMIDSIAGELCLTVDVLEG